MNESWWNDNGYSGADTSENSAELHEYVYTLQKKYAKVQTDLNNEVKANYIIRQAILKLLKVELEEVDVHPCDINNDLKANYLKPELRNLYDLMVFTEAAKGTLWK